MTAEDSLLTRTIAERDRRLAAQTSLRVAIPTWDGKMLGVYEHLGQNEFDRFVARLGPESKPSLSQAQDILIASCKQILLVEEGEHEVSDGYGRKLANRLDMPGKESATARDICLYMVGGRAFELVEHAGDVIDFLRGHSQEVEDELVGEAGSSSG
jgi:hypothetical protein